ncbi:hypothetical protein ASPZODRAFT_136183 [Penicilliopsis zonata CBS 506.65]|uniref:RecF/RecN/SMC N-terminal domain-containing protein n=1 Tax=Penicilliopsis zonata CBS 506.65 TaxID=1073090 RepID=A0A1L9S860_9EURO|nr:hypothetical protein ASPZODRAFT_136183 [Penicilliopsis zonata CBS 506.65]OJJ43339.1 hypothetical protein ASPZODRAFT_136183 [Penicilliopsis zonata CBS 506.65]
MSPSKRPQELLEPSGSESEDDSLPNNEALHPNKRIRSSEGSSEPSEDDIGEEDDLSITDADDDDDDTELDMLATQLIQEKYSFRSDEPNLPAEHGILERVECYNFMCHDHFYVELGPLINFIVGKNGSGKSAILTGITLCLGGKASSTNRGQSLKSFIKEGKENATIIVRIKNQGDGAYMPDDYGNSIIVERHFARNGTSGFKIKGENGRIISTKKAELDAITDYFSLQIDNPMNVLSQDMARQFLSTSSPAEKYKFFVKGVQLEQLDQDYRLIEDFIDQILHKLAGRDEDIQYLKSCKDAAKEKLQMSDQHESLRERIRNLRSQMAWAQVEEQERSMEELDHEIAQADTDINAAEAATGEFDVAFQEAEAELESAKRIVQETHSNLEQAKNDRDEFKGRLDEEMRQRHDLQAEQRQINELLKAAKSRVEETKAKINEEVQRMADADGGGFARKQEEFRQKELEVEEAKRQIEGHQGERQLLENHRREAEAALKEALTPVSNKKSDIEQAEAHLRNLVKDGGSQRSGFPDRISDLLRAIQQESSFSNRPVGPVGNHITLLKPKWSSVLESSFGTSLSSFIVTTKRDMNILSNIMQRVDCVCPIFIGSGGHIDTSGHEPDDRYDTALKVLDIDNDLVRRQLIINHGIEQVLLIENVSEASSFLFDGPRPQNVKRCYCIDPNDRRRGVHLSFSRTGEPSQAPVPVYSGNTRIKSDLASRITIQREVVADLKRELGDAEREVHSCRSRLESCKQALVRHERKARDLQISLQRLEDQVEELRDIIDRESIQDGHIDVLQATLREAEEERSLNQGSLDDCLNAMNAMMVKLKESNREMRRRDAEVQTLEEQHRVAQSEEHGVSRKRAKILSDKNSAIENVDIQKQAREKLGQKKERLAARIEDYCEKAGMVSARVVVDEGETPASLDKKLDKLHKDLQHLDEEIGASREEIAAEAMKANADFKQAQKQVKELKSLSEVLAATLSHRKGRWKLFRSHISSRAKAQFTYLLSERSFRGRLLTDHKGKLLDLQVEPDITKDSSAGRGARTLSGGEKSFSQVCLLLALWEAMGSPIRCLDEFDVYMDSINRQMAIDMLMLAARRSIGRQFILITPGSRTEIKMAPDVRVKELAEPERGQTTLSFRN